MKPITHLRDRGIEVSHADRVYYKKYPYRVDLGGSPTIYSDQRHAINRATKGISDRYRKTYQGTYYVENISDVELLVDVGLQYSCNVHVTGPLSQQHAQALQDHQRETQEIRKRKWYGEYDIRIKTNWWVYSGASHWHKPPEPGRFNEMVEYVQAQFDPSEYHITERRSYSWDIDEAISVPSVIYINTEHCEDIVGMLKMQFYEPGDRFSPISEFTRAVIAVE